MIKEQGEKKLFAIVNSVKAGLFSKKHYNITYVHSRSLEQAEFGARLAVKETNKMAPGKVALVHVQEVLEPKEQFKRALMDAIGLPEFLKDKVEIINGSELPPEIRQAVASRAKKPATKKRPAAKKQATA